MRKLLISPVIGFFGTRLGFWLSLVIGVVLINLGMLSLACQLSFQAVTELTEAKFLAAAKTTQRAQVLIGGYRIITLGILPDFVVADQALGAISITLQTEQQFELLLVSALQAQSKQSLKTLLPNLKLIAQKLNLINSLLPKTWVLNRVLPDQTGQKIVAATTWLADLETLVTFLSEDKQTWVVLLQNNDELRAAGGFPGSYVLLNVDQGRLAEIVVEDIYDADGQFNGYVSPPAGIKEYTSANRGLRLPDANWWPDFPKSAETILRFFALGNKPHVTGLIAVNLSTAQKILSVTGPIWLPDYQVTVTDQNIGEVLRAERSEFFPGSSQKKHLLSQTLTQLKQKLTALNPDQQRQLLAFLLSEVAEKNIQVYSLQPTLQAIISRYRLAGTLGNTADWQAELTQCQCQPVWVGLVESNVGINKVNKFVTRSTKIHFDQDSTQVTTTFNNLATPPTETELSAFLAKPALQRPRNGNGYLNYYRLLISPQYELKTITVGQTNITNWDDQLLTTSLGLELRQIGVLVAVLEQQSSTVSFELTNQTELPAAVAIYKQSGLPPTKYTLSTPNFSQEFELRTDSLISL